MHPAAPRSRRSFAIDGVLVALTVAMSFVFQPPSSIGPETRIGAMGVAAASPKTWAERAVRAYREHRADRIVAEVNQGGALVESVIRQEDGAVAYTAVHASRGKVARAEPVAALYEQGRVFHGAGLAALEEQMCLMALRGFEGKGSPDRVDALVWALTELVVAAQERQRPQVRTL